MRVPDLRAGTMAALALSSVTGAAELATGVRSRDVEPVEPHSECTA